MPSPPELAMAKAADAIPGPGAMPGGTVWEMKFDGWRLAIDTCGDKVVLWSRQGTDLTARLPEVAAAVAAQVPPGFLLDGEVVVWAGGRLSFAALQRRMTTRGALLAERARTEPASFVAFDILTVSGQDVRHLPWRDRRRLLEELARGWRPPLQLSPVTTDLAQAEDWYANARAAGIEGLVAKGAGQRYEGGKRIWVKTRWRATTDVVAGAVIGRMAHPHEVILGLPVAGRLRIVGRTAPLGAVDAGALGKVLRPPKGEHPWPEEISGAAIDRFNRDRGPVRLTRVEPVVVEVLADSSWSGSSYRHALRYLRVREDLDPGDVVPPGA